MSGKSIKMIMLVWILIFVSVVVAGEAQCRAIVQQTWESTVGQQIPDGPPGGGPGTPLLDTINVTLGFGC